MGYKITISNKKYPKRFLFSGIFIYPYSIFADYGHRFLSTIYPFNLFSCLNFCLLNNSDTKRIRSCMHTNRCSNLVDSDLIDSKPFFYQILYHLTESDCLVIVINISDAKIILTRFCIDLVQIIFRHIYNLFHRLDTVSCQSGTEDFPFF